MLLPVADLAELGIHYPCGDGIDRHLFIWVIILSADYEEQYEMSFIIFKLLILICPKMYRCLMSLICGANGLFPCPICLVPKDQLMMIWREFEKWTGAKALQLLAESRAASTLKNAEQILKNWSLHPVDVCVFLC